MAAALKKNPRFITGPAYTKRLDDMAERIARQYAVGRLIVAGDNRYLSGELYVCLQDLDAEQATRIRRAMAEEQWHFMDEDERERFLMTWLPRYTDLFDLLADFRFGGYRVLSDLICDIDDENAARDRKQLIREGDSPAFVSLMEAYQNKSDAQTYREAVSTGCRALCAWCSVPDIPSAAPKKDWQVRTDFRGLHDEFPALVDENDGGWFRRPVHRVADFVEDNPKLVSSSASEPPALGENICG